MSATELDFLSPDPHPTDSDGVLLDVRSLDVAYGRASALKDVSFSVPSGAIVVLLGRTGAGKSTTLRAVTGLLAADPANITAGSIIFTGREIRRYPPHRIAKLGIGFVPERIKVFRSLTVEENFRATPEPPEARTAGKPSGCSTTCFLFWRNAGASSPGI